MAGATQKHFPPFKFAPAWRSYEDFPWFVWALGWIALLKSSVWFFLEPASPQPAMLWKCLILSLPYLIMASGAWNLKRWAIVGLAVLGAFDLLFIISGAVEGEGLFKSAALMGANGEFNGMIILNKAVFIGARLGDLALIGLAPKAWKYAGEWNQGLWRDVVDSEDKDGLRVMIAIIYVVLAVVTVHAFVAGI